MKKILIGLFLLLALHTFAQNSLKEGAVEYTLKLDAGSNEQAGMIAGFVNGSTIGFMFKDGQFKSDIKVMGGSIARLQIIMDEVNKSGSSILLDVPMVAKKLRIPMDSLKSKKQEGADMLGSLLKGGNGEAEKPVLKKKSGSKKIAGYKCKKAELSLDGKAMTIWYAKKLKAPDALKKGFMKDLAGFPMGLEIAVKEMKLEITAKEVSKNQQDKSNFDIPEGYEIMSMEDLLKGAMDMTKKGGDGIGL